MLRCAHRHVGDSAVAGGADVRAAVLHDARAPHVRQLPPGWIRVTCIDASDCLLDGTKHASQATGGYKQTAHCHQWSRAVLNNHLLQVTLDLDPGRVLTLHTQPRGSNALGVTVASSTLAACAAYVG